MEVSVASSVDYLMNVSNNNDVTTNVRTRRSVGTSSLVARHIDSSSRIKLKLRGNAPLYVQASSNSSNLSVGPQTMADLKVCFRLHTFQVLSTVPIPGTVVVIEAMDGNKLLQGSATGTLSLTNGSNVSGLTQTDDKFFVIQQNPGDRYSYIKHLHSGRLFSANMNGVTLVSHTGAPQHSMLFERFNCTHN